jgi:hypothetical protein
VARHTACQTLAKVSDGVDLGDIAWLLIGIVIGAVGCYVLIYVSIMRYLRRMW